MGRLNGKVVIITGAAGGQGSAEARMFAKEGAKIVATDMNKPVLDEVVKSIVLENGQAIGLKHDVASEEDWNYVVQESLNAFGKIDVLVNNAGILEQVSLEESTVKGWDKVMDVNAKGTFLGIKYVIPEMKKVGGGSIINISSVASLVGIDPPSYTASKGAVQSLTKSIAIQYAKDNIRVNSVHPGLINTEMVQMQYKDPEMAKIFDSFTPMPRKMAEPEEIAYGVLYLASDESSFVTGTQLVIDGGAVAQ
ncbi:glucose 1-dehydrogenase [Bacillus sp. JJ1773]|uniref:SDR family NAD(P)-dependent oxidoreductase n=1 Tax=Bacillus sp. JJ1773 TaxID=3122965 RepID=UPI0030008274